MGHLKEWHTQTKLLLQRLALTASLMIVILALSGCQSQQTELGQASPTSETTQSPSKPNSSADATTSQPAKPVQEVASAGGVDAGMVKEGERAFKQFACGTCHMNPKAAVKSPDLRGLYGGEVKLTWGHTVKVDDAYLRESIKNPNTKIAEGYQPVMPPFAALSEEQIDQLIAYIKSLADEKPVRKE